MSAETHPTERLAERLDGRLTEDECRSVDAHVNTCSTCQETLAALRAAKKALGRLPQPDMPVGLEARVLRQIDQTHAEGRREATATGEGVPRPGWRLVETLTGWRPLVLIAATLLLAAGLYFASRPSADLPSNAAAHVSALQSKRLTLENSSTDAEVLQAYLGQRFSFRVRVFDLAMMGYTIGGGGVLDLGGHPAAAWVYRGANGLLLCEMFVAGLEDLPQPEETRVANDFTFYIYHRDGGTQVFWEEGDVLCVLSSTLPANEVIDLALAKAMK